MKIAGCSYLMFLGGGDHNIKDKVNQEKRVEVRCPPDAFVEPVMVFPECTNGSQASSYTSRSSQFLGGRELVGTYVGTSFALYTIFAPRSAGWKQVPLALAGSV